MAAATMRPETRMEVGVKAFMGVDSYDISVNLYVN